MGEDRQSGQRVTVDEAARHLKLTVDAVRKRVQRGQIAHEKDQAGRVRIILDRGETLQDDSPDNTGQAPLLEELQGRIHYLERQVEEEREARRRADTILAQLSATNAEQARTIRAIEAPRESPEAAAEESEGAGPRPATGEAQEGVQRPWWRRIFGVRG